MKVASYHSTDARYGTAPDMVQDIAPDMALGMAPVTVTRWTARLADPQYERDFLSHRFAGDRQRVFLLLAVVAAASALNFLIEWHAYSRDVSSSAAVTQAFMLIWLPAFGLVALKRVRSPQLFEALTLLGVAIATITRLGMMTLRPDMVGMWTTLMVGMIFVMYLYLPIRLIGATILAVTFSCIAPLWWSHVLGDQLAPDVFYRGLVWVALANALGFTAANSLHRSLRIQFAQSIVLRQLLSTDAMTGIANRRRFDDSLEREWKRCRRSGQPLSLLMIDVDHFKAYNDHHGHPQGDACLRQVAQLLVEAVGRPVDLVARYGGEEFVCLLPDLGSAGALTVANNLSAALRHAAIEHPRSPSGPRLTISIGVATAKKMAGVADDLVLLADKLLYAAKAAGRNQIKVGQLGAPAMTRAA